MYEIDMLPVGDGERSGDAMSIRHINPQGKQTVIVIDGGTKESGKNLVNHIINTYGSPKVDYVISTHTDADHASGLTEVLENLEVGTLLMHKPWEHAEQVCRLAQGDYTIKGMERKLAKSLQNARELEAIANRKKIPIIEPFAGYATPGGQILILGPTKEYYQALITSIAEDIGNPLSKLWSAGKQAVEEAIKFVQETWAQGSLVDPAEDATSPNNNASVIALLNLDGHKLLFTGDAGVPALNLALTTAQGYQIPLHDLRFWQVPHHGSKRNVGPTILKQIKANSAFISAAPDSPKHPSKKVTNELQRNGNKVFATQGAHIVHHNGTNRRLNPLDSLPFYDEVED